MDPVSAAGIALSIVSLFGDAYSTIKCIKRTIHTIRHFQDDKSRIVTRFEVQIARLETYSRVLSGGTVGGPDSRYLKTIPIVSDISLSYNR
jgi:hypothetical protein